MGNDRERDVQTIFIRIKASACLYHTKQHVREGRDLGTSVAQEMSFLLASVRKLWVPSLFTFIPLNSVLPIISLKGIWRKLESRRVGLGRDAKFTFRARETRGNPPYWKKMATDTFTHNSLYTKTLRTLIKTHIKVLKPWKLAYGKLLVQEQISPKNVALYLPIDCIGFARYCDQMYRHHLLTVDSTREWYLVRKFSRQILADWKGGWLWHLHTIHRKSQPTTLSCCGNNKPWILNKKKLSYTEPL